MRVSCLPVALLNFARTKLGEDVVTVKVPDKLCVVINA